jgi:hypothetical protein
MVFTSNPYENTRYSTISSPPFIKVRKPTHGKGLIG